MSETIPGGYYIGADGKPHDAHGNPIPEAAQVIEVKPAPEEKPAPKTKGTK